MQEARFGFLQRMSEIYGSDEVSTTPFESFNTADAVLWVDPLDGTSDFVKNNLPACTVLMGLSVKGFSRLGVVHQAFFVEDESKGRTYFGNAEHGSYQLEYSKDMSKEETL
jgi:3'-phosphoadenosine 5'-phosphosulfate (PAPS) 3'-phosphatase